MCSCHHPGNLVYRLHFLYTEMSCTDSVMVRTFTMEKWCKFCNFICRRVDGRNVGFLCHYGCLFSLTGGHNQKPSSAAPLFQLPRKSKLVIKSYQHVLYLWNDDYRQFLILFRLTVIVNLDYSVPGLVLADEKNKVTVSSLNSIWNRRTHLKGTAFNHQRLTDRKV